MKNFIQDGHAMTHVAAADLVSGQVVRIGNLLCIAAGDIATGATGEMATEGVFTVPKVSAAVIAQGETLTWDASAAAFDDNLATPATGDVTGPAAVAWESAGNGTTTLAVFFTGVPGTVTA